MKRTTHAKQTRSEEPLRSVLVEHDLDYGDFKQQGVISQSIKSIMHTSPGWAKMEFHQRESLDLIANKLSRLLNGNPYLYDTWFDIAGYALLIADRLKEITQDGPRKD